MNNVGLVRVSQYIALIPELKKKRPDLAFYTEQDIIRLLLQEKVTEILNTPSKSQEHIRYAPVALEGQRILAYYTEHPESDDELQMRELEI
jgi:hypothetical protein